MIEEAKGDLAVAARAGQIGRCQLGAAIQSAHAQRAITGPTDWNSIALLYEGLVRLAPSLGAHVGRAAAGRRSKQRARRHGGAAGYSRCGCHELSTVLGPPRTPLPAHGPIRRSQRSVEPSHRALRGSGRARLPRARRLSRAPRTMPVRPHVLIATDAAGWCPLPGSFGSAGSSPAEWLRAFADVRRRQRNWASYAHRQEFPAPLASAPPPSRGEKLHEYSIGTFELSQNAARFFVARTEIGRPATRC